MSLTATTSRLITAQTPGDLVARALTTCHPRRSSHQMRTTLNLSPGGVRVGPNTVEARSRRDC